MTSIWYTRSSSTSWRAGASIASSLTTWKSTIETSAARMGSTCSTGPCVSLACRSTHGRKEASMNASTASPRDGIRHLAALVFGQPVQAFPSSARRSTMMPSHLDGVLSISKIASAFDGSAHAAIVVPRRPVVFRRGGCARRVVVPAFALSQRHVTVAEFAAFLTAAGSSADAEEYLWYNPFNPMLPLRWTGSSWAYRQERAREPMTGVSVLGALAYAHAVSGTLPTVAQWLAGLAGETSLSEAGSRPRGNVAEFRS